MCSCDFIDQLIFNYTKLPTKSQVRQNLSVLNTCRDSNVAIKIAHRACYMPEAGLAACAVPPASVRVGSDSLESDEEHEEQRWPHHADDRCPGRPKGQLELVVVGFGPQGELIHDVILSSRRNHDIILL